MSKYKLLTKDNAKKTNRSDSDVVEYFRKKRKMDAEMGRKFWDIVEKSKQEK